MMKKDSTQKEKRKEKKKKPQFWLVILQNDIGETLALFWKQKFYLCYKIMILTNNGNMV